jgi:membrane glycosyltransferase
MAAMNGAAEPAGETARPALVPGNSMNASHPCARPHPRTDRAHHRRTVVSVAPLWLGFLVLPTWLCSGARPIVLPDAASTARLPSWRLEHGSHRRPRSPICCSFLPLAAVLVGTRNGSGFGGAGSLALSTLLEIAVCATSSARMMFHSRFVFGGGGMASPVSSPARADADTAGWRHCAGMEQTAVGIAGCSRTSRRRLPPVAPPAAGLILPHRFRC